MNFKAYEIQTFVFGFFLTFVQFFFQPLYAKVIQIS